MNIAVLGTGIVAKTIADKLSALGHAVKLGTRDVSQTLARNEPDMAGGPADAGERRARTTTTIDGVVVAEHPKSSYYRRGPRVRGYVARRGGYSYTYADTVGTYGSARTLFGGTSYYRDAYMDRQTSAGPFDHGFFFDSGIGMRGGESPYMH